MTPPDDPELPFGAPEDDILRFPNRKKDPKQVKGVVLVGIEGQGKTRYARELESQLQWGFNDADDLGNTDTGKVLEASRSDLRPVELAQYERNRAATLRNIICNTPYSHHRAIATTMRPLLDRLPAKGDAVPADAHEVPKAVREALRQKWIVIYLLKSPEEVAKYLFKDKDALIRRSRLRHCTTERQVCDVLTEEQRIMTPIYNHYRDYELHITRLKDDQIMRRILGCIVESLLP